jgi:arylsulfatase A-like enzyme
MKVTLPLWLALFTVSTAAATPPNLIIFLVDDMGWQDTSVPFGPERTPFNQRYRTPNMERLASGGMKFTQAYASAVCSPTRVSMMTGLNAARHRVTNWTLRKDTATDPAHPRLEFPAWNVNGIDPTGVTPRAVHARCLPDHLRAAGYHTIHVGKAHLGAIGTPGADPRKLGFEVNVAGHAAGGPGSFLGQQNYDSPKGPHPTVWAIPGLEKYHGTDTFLTEALTREALLALDHARTNRRPFFLHLSHYAVHVPFSPDDRFMQRYLDAGLDRNEAMYAALVEGMDKSLGDVLDYLDRHGLATNTVVLFTSDNGGLSAHARGGTAHTHNRPLASGKGSAYEGGIRVPLIVRWPGVVKPAANCNDPLLAEDFFPTLLDIAGLPVPRQPGGAMDGVSFVPQLKGASGLSGDRAFVWHYPNLWGASGPGIGPSSSIRVGDWKYIFYHDPERPVRRELFNLKADLGETTNLVAAEPQKAAELARHLQRHLADANAQMPKVKATGETIHIQ